MDHDVRDETGLERRVTGRIGFAATLLFSIALGVHPFSTDALYMEAERFAGHITGPWLFIHLLGAALLPTFVVVVRAWTTSLAGPVARVLGRLAVAATVAGTAIGAYHLVAPDTMALQILNEVGAGDSTGFEVLLAMHGATLLAWTLTMFVVAPGLAATAMAFDGGAPRWHVALLAATALLGLAALVTVGVASRWTFAADMLLFRPAVTLWLVWMLVTTREIGWGEVRTAMAS